MSDRAENQDKKGQPWLDRSASAYRIIWNRTERMAAGGNVRVRYQANWNPNQNTIDIRMAFVHGNFSNKPKGA
ncbi:hypothetical protein [Ruegeria denitrificans]|uniref:hypothetical protein n=1 Tax=Ruegeria denitrificans TaxID=1715692 RepID=UPI00071D48F0|nr:hypothetical protein [Ruegeria denitrificans]